MYADPDSDADSVGDTTSAHNRTRDGSRNCGGNRSRACRRYHCCDDGSDNRFVIRRCGGNRSRDNGSDSIGWANAGNSAISRRIGLE